MLHVEVYTTFNCDMYINCMTGLRFYTLHVEVQVLIVICTLYVRCKVLHVHVFNCDMYIVHCTCISGVCKYMYKF